MTRPFRFGLSAHRAGSAAEWREIATKAEGLGYSTLLMADHLNDQLAPIPALGVAAAVTTTLRVGTMVLCNDLRRAPVLAKELATLDLLSDGRLEWGMGAGWFPADYEPAGIPFDEASTRVDRLGETIAAVKALFGGEPVELAGEHVQLHGLVGTPAPVQRPHPPLAVGASQERMLRLAGREADVESLSPDIRSRQYGPFPASRTVTEAMDRQVGIVRAAAGDRADDLELSVNLMPARVLGNRAAFAERVAGNVGLTPDETLASPHVLVGSVDDICEQLEERRSRWGISYHVLGAQVIDEMAPVVARMTGR